jgi:hypothetical protein
MNVVWLFIGAFHLVSVAFLGLSLVRLYGYVRRYKLIENRHTLLFGFVHLEHVVLIYILFITAFTFGSVLFISSLPTT